jgi:hypothetical protein
MKRIAPVCTGGLLALALLSGAVAADPIYRSVDAQGNVTFSNKPPANAVTVDKVDVQPGPSEAAQREAQERMQRQEAAANEMSEASARRDQQKPAASPAVPDTVEPAEPVNQYSDYQYGNTPRRDQIRDRLPERPVKLPARPVQMPARPVAR